MTSDRRENYHLTKLRESLSAYRRALIRHTATLITSAIAALASLALVVHPIILPAWAWFLIGIASFGWVNFRAFDDVRIQRDTARTALSVAAAVPSLKIEAPAVSADVRRTESGYFNIVVVSVRLTNRESTRLSLDLRLMVELVKRPGDAIPLVPAETIIKSRAIYEQMQRDRAEGTVTKIDRGTMLPATLHLEPLSTLPLELGFGWYDDSAFADPPPDSSASGAPRTPFNSWGDKLRLDVTDHISGQTVSLYVPGAYETRRSAEFKEIG